ncbi:hypothetical protein SAMN04487970_1012119 [Paenibacillus tianmuensis]|uniref:DUF7716 domain-containing protein n=1 Tax=Paenibacillus tianmuensis TaxID=624147 RepID=A0A1G4R6T9_9BACL|nr:hypothetical protein [Paenibacillus tianmuensis]SCW52564.1 hypothetical protein SAMN04487970_1012119 [Paenibacillus tianmuensis]
MDCKQWIRVPLTMEELISIPQDVLDEHALYVHADMEYIDKETIVYLDDMVDVDDETVEEIYPEFSVEHNLQWFFSGQVVFDIIDNTKHQLPNPTIDDYIKNFSYYNENDCFFTF